MTGHHTPREALHAGDLAQWWNDAAQAAEAEAVLEDGSEQRSFLLVVARAMRAEATRHQL